MPATTTAWTPFEQQSNSPPPIRRMRPPNPEVGLAITFHAPGGDQRAVLHPGEQLMVQFEGGERAPGVITGLPPAKAKGPARKAKRRHPSGLSYRQRQARGRAARQTPKLKPAQITAAHTTINVTVRGDAKAMQRAIKRTQARVGEFAHR